MAVRSGSSTRFPRSAWRRHSDGSPLVAWAGTAGGWLIERAAGQNLARHSGYKALSTEALAALDADLLIVADRSLSGGAASAALLKNMPVLAWPGRAAGADLAA